MVLYQPKGQPVIESIQHKHIQGWQLFPLELQTSRSYIDDLHHFREQLEKRSSLLFVKDPSKTALELLLHSDDGKAYAFPDCSADLTSYTQMIHPCTK